jgi:1-aminocyclopropane-1-carboxylate deaminase/D-cysteine desulfhydrase-like pyridoxal-dependent ACC family enzyme
MRFPLPPIEQHQLGKRTVYVVRDDLCSPFPGPNFSKVRGLYKALLKLREQGVREVVSQDTSISRCGWGCSWLAQELDITHYNVYAMRKQMNFYQRMSRSHGGKMVAVRGSFSSAMQAQARKLLGDLHFLPTGFSLPETLGEHRTLLNHLPRDLFAGTVVVCVSSGTICSSLLYGLQGGHVYGVTSSCFNNRLEKIDKLVRRAEISLGRRAGGDVEFTLITTRHGYSKPADIETPFPCDVYLDRKAWKWLVEHLNELQDPVVFWNIGGEWDPKRGLVGGMRGDGIITSKQVEDHLNLSDLALGATQE